MSSNTNNKDPRAVQAENQQNQQKRAETIRGLISTPEEQLQAREQELFRERQDFYNTHMVKVSNLRRTVRVLKQELDKYPGIQNQYDQTFAQYEKALQESQKKENEINQEIQNIQAARMVKRDAVALNAQKEIDENAVKAAMEGQKPFTPQITPDQNFELVAITKQYANQIAKEPEESKPSTSTSTSGGQGAGGGGGTGNQSTSTSSNTNVKKPTD